VRRRVQRTRSAAAWRARYFPDRLVLIFASGLGWVIIAGFRGTMDFRIGDKVVYPNHGVGIIEQVSQRMVNGVPEDFTC